MDRYGRMKKKIDKYFYPLQISPNTVLEVLRSEQKKQMSSNKMKQDALGKISEETKKLQLLKITGTELNHNCIGGGSALIRQRISPLKKTTPSEFQKNKIKAILGESLESIVQKIKKDPQSHLFANELEQLSKFKCSSSPDSSKKLFLSQSHIENENKNEKKHDSLRYQEMIVSNPTLYRKMIIASQTLERKRKSKPSLPTYKKVQISEALSNNSIPRTIKKIEPSEKDLSSRELKKFINFVQYREFLLTLNISNKMIRLPEPDGQYKAFICKGNNGLLVKSIIKTRPWWALRSDSQNCTLVWSEWKKAKLINLLPNKEKRSKYEHNEISEGQKQNGERNKSSEMFISKMNQVNQIINLQKSFLKRYIHKTDAQGNIFTFTKKINDKSLQEILAKVIPSKVEYQTYERSKKEMTIHNHLPGCLQLHSKKLLFLNMKQFYEANQKDIFEIMPETHLIKDGINDPNYHKFVARWTSLEKKKIEGGKNKAKNIWICKPGENSNRGNGISVVSSLQQVISQIAFMGKNSNRTLIVQKYMQNPYLFNKRKFDMRCYLLVTSVNGIIKGYFFNEGYIRTTSKQFSLKNLDNKFIHLTNDAIQKKDEEYGKFENCNKVSFAEFQKYLESIDKNQPPKFIKARAAIKQIIIDMVKSVASKLNPTRKQFCFELFGLDFMLDSSMKAYLIEANSNPCLQVDGSVLSKIIPTLIENVIKIAIDPIFPPPYSQTWKNSKFSPGNPFEQNKFELIYDSLQDLITQQSETKPQDKELNEEQQMGEESEENQNQ